MSKKFTLEQLTEGIRQRHQGDANARLTEKWARTGLLRGLESVHRENMATLLENQAGQVLRESNTLGGGGLTPSAASGDIRGFTNIAFPIVRRVFGGLVANELVSIQPMSLPSGLLFYLDYTYGTNVGGASDGTGSDTKNTYSAGDSIYNSPAGKGVRSGSLGVGGQYDLAGSGYSKHQGMATASGVQNDADTIFQLGTSATQTRATGGVLGTSGADGRFLQFDPQVSRLIDEEGGVFSFMAIPLDNLPTNADLTAVKEIALHANTTLGAAAVAGLDADAKLRTIPATIQGVAGVLNVRRLNQIVTSGSAAPGATLFPIASAPFPAPASLLFAPAPAGSGSATAAALFAAATSDGATLFPAATSAGFVLFAAPTAPLPAPGAPSACSVLFAALTASFSGSSFNAASSFSCATLLFASTAAALFTPTSTAATSAASGSDAPAVSSACSVLFPAAVSAALFMAAPASSGALFPSTSASTATGPGFAALLFFSGSWVTYAGFGLAPLSGPRSLYAGFVPPLG